MHALDLDLIPDQDRSPIHPPPPPPPPQHPHFTRFARSRGTMRPDSKLILDEMHRLFKEQKSDFDSCFIDADRKLDSLEKRFADSYRTLQKRFTAINTSIAKQLTDLNESLTKCLANSDLSWERRITDSELRQSSLILEAEQR
jgi:hypothetical protein